MCEKTSVNYWLIPCNVSLYDPFRAFFDLKTIDWRQSTKVCLNDYVLIYCTKPYQKIMFLTQAIKTNISDDEVSYEDISYNKDPDHITDVRSRYGYMRLKLIKAFNNESFSLENLRSAGLYGAPQGPLKLKGQLLRYILDSME